MGLHEVAQKALGAGLIGVQAIEAHNGSMFKGSRGMPILAAAVLAGTCFGQGRLAAPLSQNDARLAIEAGMRAAMAFEPAPGLSREQVGTLSRVVASARRGDMAAALSIWGGFVGSAKSLGGISSENIMATLYYVMRESVLESNEDKKYYLSKLKRYNQLGRQLSDYLKELGAASDERDGARGVRQVEVLTIQGSGETLALQRGSRRAMSVAEARSAADAARRASGSLDYAIGQCQRLLRNDLAKDLALLRKLLVTLRQFEDETKKKLAG